ncbi:putative G antigen family E member 3 [Zalophus californianus]|uniref:G antigen family E member 3 n=1 Tax=Zalophus californianus TaxID=9704 RepID=A0A6J2E564_ZALCA|nr:putative G antigen family E member 3 [Zalophus californianus]
MSGHVQSRSQSKQRRNDQKSSQGIDIVVAQRRSDGQLKQKKAPFESQDIIPDQGKEDKGASGFEGPGLKADLWELAESNIWGEGQSQD